MKSRISSPLSLVVLTILCFSATKLQAQNNVGIGTVTPAEKLEIIGNVKSDTAKVNALQMIPGSGSGKVLTSDANGNASWQNQGGVGSSGSNWTILGNTGTNTLSNFIGTSDNAGLRFRIYNIQAGELSDTSLYNTSLGFRSMMNNVGGNNNLAFGSNALRRNTGGNFNTGIGAFSLYSNLNGEKNIGIGANALYKNLSNHNIAIGYASLFNDTTGSRNIGIGTNSLFFGAAPQRNIAIGFVAGQFINSADNVVIGDNAGQALSLGQKNIVIGNNAEVLEKNMAGAIGYGAYSNQDSVIALGSSIHKVAIARMTADEKLHVGGDVKIDGLSGTGERFVFTDAQGKLFDSSLVIGSGNGTVTDVTAGSGLVGGTITSSGTISMPYVGTAGVYGNSTSIPVITTDSQGRVSNVTLAAVAPGADNWGTQSVVANAAFSGNGTSASPLSLAQNGASTNQVLTWNGTAWVPANASGSGWGLTGNAATVTDFLGTTNAQPLRIFTNNVERFSIASAGGIVANTGGFAINNTGAGASASAQLDIASTTKGILVPRMTTAQRTAIAAPATGLMVYDNTTGSFWYYNGTVWLEILNNSSGWGLNGNSVAATNFIGTTNAQPFKLYSNNTERMRINPTDGEIVAGAAASPYAGDLHSAVSTPTLTFANNGYSANNGSGTWGEVLSASTTAFSAVQGVYGGSGAGAGVLGNYAGTNTSNTRSGVYGTVTQTAANVGGAGVYGYNGITSGSIRMGMLGAYNGAAFGIGVTGIGFGGGIMTGNNDVGVVGWRANNGNYSGYFNGNHVIANGTKSASVATSKGNQLLYVTETPEVWFEDIGGAKLSNGEAKVELDPLFLETVIIDSLHPMRVFVQMEDESEEVFVQKGQTGFTVKERNNGQSNAAFSYRVMAKRVHFQDHRFGNDPVWGPGDTRKYAQYATPPPVDYDENIKFQEQQKRDWKQTPMPQGFIYYDQIQKEAAERALEKPASSKR